MKSIKLQSLGNKWSITKAQAMKAVETAKAELPPHKAQKIVFPERPGVTVRLNSNVDLTKVRNNVGPIPFRWVLVGSKASAQKVVEALAA